VTGLVVIVVLFALFWLLLIRPQRRRQAEQNALIQSVEVGDEIVTAGGLFGHVQSIADDELLVEIAPGTTVRIARRAVAGIVGLEDEEADEGEEGEEGEEGPEAVVEATEHETATEETPR
jgi:preprotein translocase subunit YajC